jgi:lipopolysaccharide transport system ATP-binding protein
MPSDDIAISVRGLSKSYVISHNAPKHTMLGEALMHKLRRPFAKSSRETFWALKDLSLQINKGEVVGVIGRNGAGKSTFLKILSRITEPTDGRIDLYGRVGSLLEVGTGFHPELTGRENIYLNGQILGMRKKEIQRQFDAIVDFADVEKFLDTPVKRYSSGMYVRLAFAVAAHLDSEILLVDEVLAVGDAEFQKKCLGKMSDVARSGRTVLFVSHNMAAISTLCSQAVVLHKGRLASHGSTADAIAHYTQEGHYSQLSSWKRNADAPPSGPLVFTAIQSTLTGEQPNHVLRLRIKMNSHRAHKPAFLAVDVLDNRGIAILQAIPTLTGFIRDNSPTHEMELAVDLPPLIPGNYQVTLWAGSHNTETFDQVDEIVAFDVEHSPTEGRTFPHNSSHGYVVPPSRVTLFDREATVALESSGA